MKYSSTPDTKTGLSTTGGDVFDVLIETPLYRQHDDLWATTSLGGTGDTISSHGCTVCSTAMSLSAHGYKITPLELNNELISHQGFTENALLIWSAISSVTDGKFSVIVEDSPSHEDIDQQLKLGNPVIAKVLYKNVIFHWVLITGKNSEGYIIQDPLSKRGSNIDMSDYESGIFTIRFLKVN
ncbi:C39 family peptidase [Rubritalea tangerina]|uniref:C39 family peptidase n=1 Tax=Rubritalea tangerina TaxID=430798 RepID=A0ABW4Z5R2_9BACT